MSTGGTRLGEMRTSGREGRAGLEELEELEDIL